MNELLTPANFILRMLSKAMDISNIDMDAVFSHAGVSPQVLLSADGLITIRDLAALLGSAHALSDDPALGLHFGEDIGPEMLDLVGMIVSSAPDLRTACQMVHQFERLLATYSHFGLKEQGDEAWLLWDFADEIISANAFFSPDSSTAGTLNIIRSLLQGEFRIKRLHCRHGKPEWAEEYRRVFGAETEIRFSAQEDALVFDRGYLDMPLAKYSPALYDHLRAQATQRLSSITPQESTSATVQRLINELFGSRLIHLSVIAEIMDMNPRRLQRYLREENTNFVNLLEGCRFRRARERLSSSDMEVDALAAHLGYSEPASFYRAFKVWSGLTPNEYRQRYRRKDLPSANAD